MLTAGAVVFRHVGRGCPLPMSGRRFRTAMLLQLAISHDLFSSVEHQADVNSINLRVH
jgi:hypothetical protein